MENLDMEPLKLLLLDNDPVTLDLLQVQFRRKNDEIHVCEQPSALVQFFGKDLPDVVILAREWSENSLETLDLLKREWEDIPVIFVSQNGSVISPARAAHWHIASWPCARSPWCVHADHHGATT